MRPRLRTVATLVAAIALAAGTTACSGSDDTEPDAAPSSTGTAPTSATPTSASADRPTEALAPVTYRWIPKAVLRSHGFGADTPVDLKRWEPRLGYTKTAVGVRDRRMPACDKPTEGQIAADRTVRDFGDSLTRDGDFIVARQLTIYSGDVDAKAFAQQWYDAPKFCRSYNDGTEVVGFSHREFGRDRYVGTRTDLPTLYSEGLENGKKRTMRYIDVVTRVDNAVVFTRVVETDATEGDLLSNIRKPVNQPMRRAVVRAADAGAAVLEDLPTRS